MRILVLSVLVAGCSLAADLQTVSDFQTENVRSRELIGKISKSEFVALASEFLKSKDITAGAIAVYGSKRDRVLAGPYGVDHCSYDLRRSIMDYNYQPPSCPEVKEAIRIGSAIVVRTVDSNRRRSRDLIQGSTNPLILDGSGPNIEILHLTLSQNLGRVGVQAYIRTNSSVNTVAARSLTERVRDMTGVRDVLVSLRSDVWFFNECEFPTLYPFEIHGKVPNREEWYKTKYAVCSASAQWPTNCFESASRP